MARSPLLDMVFGYMPAQIVHATAELRLADLLAGGPRSSEELAGAAGAHAPSLYRLLRALASLGVVEQTGPDLFALTPLGGQLRTGAPDSVRALVLLFCGAETWGSWGDLVGTLRTGEPAWEKVAGADPFTFMASHPELSAAFNAAMAEHTRTVAPSIIEGYDFTAFGTVADLGGGDGTLIAAILAAVPGLRGILFDLPAGVVQASERLKAAGVEDRCQLVTGDLFEKVPPGADAYLLKSVIHDWDDDRAAAILRRCREAMAPDAKLLIIETVEPPVVTPEAPSNALSDINMLVATGGLERTESQYRALLSEAGLTLTGLTGPLSPSNYRVIESTPA